MTDSLSSDQLAQALQEWFVRGSAPICWVQDANSGGVAGTARPLLASTPGSCALWWAFANPDRCLFVPFGTVCAAMLRELPVPAGRCNPAVNCICQCMD